MTRPLFLERRPSTGDALARESLSFERDFARSRHNFSADDFGCQECHGRGCDYCEEMDPLAASLFRAGVELNRALYGVNEEADAA